MASARQTVGDALAAQDLAFGTSGVRGLAASFSAPACQAAVSAFLRNVVPGSSYRRLVIGSDRRPSSPAIAAECAHAARVSGFEVINAGVVPTPVLALACHAHGIPGVMVTGSHIPFDRNGLKFYRPDGELTKDDEQRILAAEVAELDNVDDAPLPDPDTGIAEDYVARYLACQPAKPFEGLRVGLYEHSSAGRDLYAELLTRLGADLVSLGRTDSFVPIDTEAVSETDRQLARQWVRNYELDCLFSTDGDGDRPLVADEQGEWLRGDVLGLLTARYLGIEALAVPINANTGIEACGAFKEVLRTRIGSPHVIAAMGHLSERYDQVAAFEANGGFLLGSAAPSGVGTLAALPTRDALLPLLVVLTAAVEEKQPLSALVADLPARSTASGRLQDVPSEASDQLLAAWRERPEQAVSDLALVDAAIAAVDQTDGLRLLLLDGRIVHFRPSGNAPELRCYAEASTTAEAEQLMTYCLERLSGVLGEA